MNDHRLCPHCLKPINPRPYLMSVDPDAAWPAWWPAAACLLAVLILAGVLRMVGA